MKSTHHQLALLLALFAVEPVSAQQPSLSLCTPDSNILASTCVGTFASTAMSVRNDLFGFFLGRRPIYTETDALSGVGDKQLREYGAPDWNRTSELWATRGAALSTNLSYPAPQGNDPLWAQATAGALLAKGSLGVSTRNYGLAHSPSNVYSPVASAYGSLAEVINVVAPAFSDSVTVRVSMTVSGMVDQTGPSLGPFPFASAALGLGTLLNGSSTGGETDYIDIYSEGSVTETLSVVATAMRPAGIAQSSPFTAQFRLAGTLRTETVNTQYPYDLDFGRTAYFDLEVPTDASWSSYSGVFLTQAVPELSTNSLLPLGLVTLLLIKLRRDKTIV